MIIIITAISAVIASVSLDCHARRGAATGERHSDKDAFIHDGMDASVQPAPTPHMSTWAMAWPMASLRPSPARARAASNPNRVDLWNCRVHYTSLSLVVRVVRGQKLLSAATANDKAYAAKSPTSANTKHALQMPTSFFFLFSKLMSAPQEF